jgi:WD40 repeat protein
MTVFRLGLIALLAMLGLPAAAAEVSFLRDVAPILTGRCTGCHGAVKSEGDYRLHAFAFLQNAGASGERPVVPGRPSESEIYRRIVAGDASERMPQDDDPLAPAEIGLIRRWIEGGAKFDGADPSASIKSLMPPRQHPASPAAYRVPVPVFAVAFSPDGSELAVGGNYEVTIWNPADGRLRRRMPHLPQRIQSLAYSRDGKQLFVAGGTPGDYGELSVVDAHSGAKLGVLDTCEDVVLAAALSGDGTLVALGSADRSTRVYRTADRRRVWLSQLHSDWVTGVSFSADGRFLASASKDTTIKVHEAATGELFTTYTGHQQDVASSPDPGRLPVYDVVFAADAPWAISAGEGKAFRVWNPRSAKAEGGTAKEIEKRFAKSGHTRFVKAGEFPVFRLALGKGQFYAATVSGLVNAFDLASGNMIRTFAGHRDRAYALAYHAASGRLASGANDGEVRIWNAADGRAIATFFAAPGYQPTLAQTAGSGN